MSFRGTTNRRIGPPRVSLTNNAMIGKLESINRQNSLYDMVHTFKCWDKDKSNAISFPEFIRMAKKIPMLREKNEATLKKIFENIDVDDSGAITIPEFRILWNEVPKLSKISMVPYPDKNLDQLRGVAFLRQYLYYTLDLYETNLGKYCRYTMFFLILFSVSCYCLETVPSLKGWFGWRILDA